ncbi:unnamed protein product [Moneuplotes crassus]|uniref:Uncharacterized protein n=1 Tax=Euplotes crassus TaxID=5936 RepID=A0AAD1XP87_EUPCR|nr:unnamed protein product [Moneuplotes crassus]
MEASQNIGSLFINEKETIISFDEDKLGLKILAEGESDFDNITLRDGYIDKNDGLTCKRYTSPNKLPNYNNLKIIRCEKNTKQNQRILMKILGETLDGRLKKLKLVRYMTIGTDQSCDFSFKNQKLIYGLTSRCMRELILCSLDLNMKRFSKIIILSSPVEHLLLKKCRFSCESSDPHSKPNSSLIELEISDCVDHDNEEIGEDFKTLDTILEYTTKHITKLEMLTIQTKTDLSELQIIDKNDCEFHLYSRSKESYTFKKEQPFFV